jgi:hypothetical protein
MFIGGAIYTSTGAFPSFWQQVKQVINPNNPSETPELKGTPYYPYPKQPSLLYSINDSYIQGEEFVMIMSLQGLLAKIEPRIYISSPGPYEIWLDLMRNQGTSVIQETNPWSLLERFAANISGYILYEKDTDGATPEGSVWNTHTDESYCIAVSMCGVLNACAVEISDEQRAIELNLTKVFDARGLTMDYLFEDEVWNLFRHDMSFEVEHHTGRRFFLIDYPIFAQAPIWHAANAEKRAEYLQKFDDDFGDFGWGAVIGGECDLNMAVTQAGGYFVPADWMRDLSTFAAYQMPTKQRTPPSVVIEEDVHYVTIILSDGDNLQWTTGSYAGPDYFGNSHRGEFPMGWQMQPVMAELCPIILDYYYTNAGPYDRFVTGVSGFGLTYPNSNPIDELHVQRSEYMLNKSDLNIVVVQDYGWNSYHLQILAHLPSVTGIVHVDYDDYNKYAETIEWFNDDPAIGFTYNYWKGFPEDTADAISDSINQKTRNIHSHEAYSIINVHAWSYNMDGIAALVEKFDPDVRVVDPETFFTLIKENVAHESFFPQIRVWRNIFIGTCIAIGISFFVLLYTIRLEKIQRKRS